MNKLMLKLSFILGVILVLTACPNISEGTVIHAVPAKSITLNKGVLEITIAKPATLIATVEPSNTTNKTVLWQSSDTSIVTVNAGLVTGVKVGGPVTIEASIDGRKATCQVTVITPPPATKIELDYATVKLAVGAIRKLGYTLTPELSEDTVTWESSDSGKVTVSEDGTLTAVAVGDVTITATTKSGKTATCSVNVRLPNPATNISIPASLSIYKTLSEQITLTLTPPDTTDEVIWTTNDKSVATVSAAGKVTAQNIGTATITAKAGDHTATCLVTVTMAPKAITSFSFTKANNSGLSSDTNCTINESNKTITVTVPYLTNVTALKASFTAQDASVSIGSTQQESGTSSNNFTDPVEYTVKAKDGSSVKYTVTVSVAKNPAKAITQFVFYKIDNSELPADITGIINEANKTIRLEIPNFDDVTALKASFGITGESLKVGNTPQISRTTANNFTNPVTYTVTAADGTTANYKIIVVALKYDEYEGVKKNGILLEKTATKKLYVDNTYVIAGNAGYDSPVFIANRTIKFTKYIAMGKYEVTQELYEAVMGNNPSYFVGTESDKVVAAGEVQKLRPVEMVTWYDAVEFCNKLSKAVGLEAVYTISNRSPSTGYPIIAASVSVYMDANGFRLPTEAEWEYTARGRGAPDLGSDSVWMYKYPGSNDVDTVAWHSHNSSERTREVGKKSPNTLGLYDMGGNVYEWCWDWLDTRPTGHQDDPVGPETGTYKIACGGSSLAWSSESLIKSRPPSFCFLYPYPSSGKSYVGFRVVCKP